MPRFYVYSLDREEGGPSFYIGKGTGKRIDDHEIAALKGEDSHKARIIRKVISELGYLPKRKLVEGLNEEEAFAVEVSTIVLLGRYPDGPLVNKTDGGEGVPGLWDDPEVREKARLSHEATWRDPARSEMRSKSMRDGWAKKMEDSDYQNYISEIRREVWNNPDLVNRVAVAQETSWAENYEQRLEAILAGWRDPVERARRIQAIKDGIRNGKPRDIESFKKKVSARWADPEFNAEQTERIKRVWDDPALIEKASASAVDSWKDPEVKARRAQSMRDGWARRRARLAEEKNKITD